MMESIPAEASKLKPICRTFSKVSKIKANKGQSQENNEHLKDPLDDPQLGIHAAGLQIVFFFDSVALQNKILNNGQHPGYQPGKGCDNPDQECLAQNCHQTGRKLQQRQSKHEQQRRQKRTQGSAPIFRS